MKLIKLSIISFVLVVRPCLGKLVIATSYQELSTSRLVKNMGNILTSCYGDQINGVGLVGNLPSTLSSTLSDKLSIPLTLIKRKRNRQNKPSQPTNNFRYNLHFFIIEGSSTQQLDKLIRKTMKASVWWNHMASFFILDLSRGCVNAKEFLLLAWKNDMLNAKVMCRSNRKGRIIFNYNPFTSQAPVSWQRVEVFPGIKRQPFTLLRQKYQENETMCPDQNFDKTKDLGRYRIHVEGIRPDAKEIFPGQRKGEKPEFYAIRNNIVENVFRALNIRAKYTNKENYWDRISGDTDMVGHTLELQFPLARMSVPTGCSGRSIVTQFTTNEPRRFKESFTIRDIDAWFGSPVVYLITLLVLKVFVDNALAPILLYLIPITCKTTFINLPNIKSTRTYLTGVCFFAIMMQATFHGSLISPLTKQTPCKNVKTVKDLVDLGYKQIYLHDEKDRQYFEDVGPLDIINLTSWEQCIVRVKNSSSAACVGDFILKLDMVEKFNLRESRQIYRTYYEGFPIRFNWPLEERINTMLARSVEANVLEPWYLKFNSITSRILRKGESDLNNKNAESIKLGEISFIFGFLGIGLACATIVFIIESVYPYRCRCRVRYERRYWHVNVKKNGFVPQWLGDGKWIDAKIHLIP